MSINPSEPGIGDAQGSCSPSVPASDFTSKPPGFHALPPVRATKDLQLRNAPIFHENQSTLACPWNTQPSISPDLSRTKAKSDSMTFRRLWGEFKHSQVDIAVRTGKMGSTVGAPIVPQHHEHNTALAHPCPLFQGLQTAQQGRASSTPILPWGVYGLIPDFQLLLRFLSPTASSKSTPPASSSYS